MGGGSTDYRPSSYDFSNAPSVSRRSAASYAAEDNRVYSSNTSKGIKPPVGKDISTNSNLALILVVDVTGSMKERPKELFKKFPTLLAESNTAIQGLKLKDVQSGQSTVEDKLEIAVVAIGDATIDRFPLQVVDFSKGTDLVEKIDKILPEGGGGPGTKESYELGAYYVLNHCHTPNMPEGTKPLVIFIGDERYYNEVNPAQVKALIGDDLTGPLDSAQVFKDLKEKFDVRVLRPEESYSQLEYKRIREQWEGVLGQSVLKMDDASRFVDTVVACCGDYADNLDEAINLLKRRQTPEQVKSVLATLHPKQAKKEGE